MTDATIEFDVPVPMRDGVVLRADVYRPQGDGPWPVIVARTPYGKSNYYELLEPLQAVRRGFIAIVQDVRGCFASEGEFVPLVNEAPDGADTIDWAASLPGSSGSVGMWGLSYLGNVQWQAASEQPAALKAIAYRLGIASTHEPIRPIRFVAPEMVPMIPPRQTKSGSRTWSPARAGVR